MASRGGVSVRPQKYPVAFWGLQGGEEHLPEGRGREEGEAHMRGINKLGKMYEEDTCADP